MGDRIVNLWFLLWLMQRNNRDLRLEIKSKQVEVHYIVGQKFHKVNDNRLYQKIVFLFPFSVCLNGVANCTDKICTSKLTFCFCFVF